MATEKRFDIVFEGHGRMSGKMRNDISVDFVTMKEHYDLATDKGPFHGGDGTAPPPLALFTAALTGCFMTQVRAFSKRLRIPVRDVDIRARLHWQGVQEGNEPYTSEPVGFSLDVELDTDASEEDQARLLDAARKGCFIEASLAKGVIVEHRLKVGDGWRNV